MGKGDGDKLGLTDRQEAFCREYVVDFNATRAATVAGYSAKTAAEQGHQQLQKPSVIARIDELKGAAVQRVVVETDTILQELLRLGTIDASELYNEDGTIKKPKDWPKHIGACIASVEVEELFEGRGKDREQVGFTTKVKLWPKVQALELLGRYKKLFTDKVEHGVSKSLEDLLAGSKEKE